MKEKKGKNKTTKSATTGNLRTTKEGNRLRELMDELHEEGKEKKRAEDILRLIRQREIEREVDASLMRHAKICAKIFLNKIFADLLNNKNK